MADLAATTSALQGAVTSIPAETAAQVVDGWVSQLQGTPGGEQIVMDLQALKSELGKGSGMNGSMVKQLTAKLGEQTTVLASQGGGSSDDIRKLGMALIKAAS